MQQNVADGERNPLLQFAFSRHYKQLLVAILSQQLAQQASLQVMKGN